MTAVSHPWHRWLVAWRERRALRRFAIGEALWAATVARYPFLAVRPAADLTELRRLSSLFLAGKEFHGAHGLSVTDEMAVAIAAQACLPVLRLDLALYDGFVGIVVHDDEVWAPREVVDELGVVHEYHEPLTGEALDGGPLMLAWADVAGAAGTAAHGYNVVIHEFAHVIDMAEGLTEGVAHDSAHNSAHHNPVQTAPAAARPLGRAERRWNVPRLAAEFSRFKRRVATVERDGLVPDPYGAESPSEFFAVASEAFFVAPRALRAQQPRLYALLAAYYRQDPASVQSNPA